MKAENPSPATDDTRLTVIEPLARRVREAREAMGLPRRVLSEKSGVSLRYLAQLEAGEGNVSIVLLERIARALNTTIPALITDEAPLDPHAARMARLYSRAGASIQEEVDKLLERRTASAARAGRICLIGLRGAGKSTLGKRLGQKLNVPFVELGEMIEEETGMPTGEVLSLYGQDGYRRLEADALERVLAREAQVVLAVSGGFVEQEAAYTTLLAQFHAVWLRCSAQEHVARTRAQLRTRATGNADEMITGIERLLETRGPLYEQAGAVVDTGGRTEAQALAALLDIARDAGFTTPR